MKRPTISLAALLLFAGAADAGPRVAKSDAKSPDDECVAWVENKCVAHKSDTKDDDATPAKPEAKPVDAPATVTSPTPDKPPPTPAPKQTAAVESISSSNTVGQPGAQSQTDTSVTVKDVKFELHGYARMPLSAQGKREPYLVDNDYFLSGFAYTRLYEPDWSELFFSARRGNYKAEFGLFASLYSDYASARLENQFGIAQASVTAENFLEQDGLSVQLGVFWDRFGHIQPYDTYIFGRTHQGGVKVAYALPGGGKVQTGIGMHQAELQQNLGMTPVAHLAGTYPVGPVEVGGYLLRTWTRDQRQLSPIQDGTMYVAGLDGRYKLPGELGTAYLAFAYYNMKKVLYLAPALEVMHSTGGRGLTENFLGTDASEDGTGSMYTLAADVPIAVTDKIGVRAFGMTTWVRSKQVDEMDPLANRDRRLYLKWGLEPSYKLLKQLQVSARYDRVVLDVYDSENSFRVLSPRVTFPLDTWGEIFLMYSHYWYGDKVHLRAGQVPLETEPDSDVFKLQAQVVW
ncbi:MAG TPA: hypothetical protein VFQ53_42795 [Kofleriaceae bacterium]|nr:hypothetical protein [Kofleriaceae bacterium]